MAKGLGEIDSSDTYPLSNLPGAAVPWGNAITDDVIGLKREVEALRMSLEGLRRDVASIQGNQVTTVQTPMSYTESDTDQLIHYTESGFLYTNTSVVVPTGAVSATITGKGQCKGINDVQSPPAALDVETSVFYAHVADWPSYTTSSNVMLNTDSATVPINGVATAIASGSVTIPVTPGWLLIVGLASRVSTYGTPAPYMHADAFVSGNILFNFS